MAHEGQRGLVVQYRDLTACDIMIIENNEMKRVSEPALYARNLCDVLEEMIEADKNLLSSCSTAYSKMLRRAKK
jgi:hypothetical protein